MTNDFTTILTAFGLNTLPESIESLGNGLINKTYRVSYPEASFVLQQINHYVFTDIDSLSQNKAKVASFILTESNGTYPAYPSFRKVGEKHYYTDKVGQHWQISDFIAETKIFETPKNCQIASEAGLALAKLHVQLSNFPVNTLSPVLPNLHKLTYHMQALHKNKLQAKAERLTEASDLIDFAETKLAKHTELQEMMYGGEFPLRACHNDTKIGNILFDANDNALFYIDLDTMSPGTLILDYADLLRSVVNTSHESETPKVNFDKDKFEALTTSYIENAMPILQTIEIEMLIDAAQYLVYVQFIRFLSDWLANDTYYKVSHPLENINRAKNQHLLYIMLHEHKQYMINYVDQVVNKQFRKQISNLRSLI